MNQKGKIILWSLFLVLLGTVGFYVAHLSKTSTAVQEGKKASVVEQLTSRIETLEQEMYEIRIEKMKDEEKVKISKYPLLFLSFSVVVFLAVIVLLYAKTMNQIQLLKNQVNELSRALKSVEQGSTE